MSLGSEQVRCVCKDVLIVDDEVFNQFTFQALLNSYNVKADCAINGLEAF